MQANVLSQPSHESCGVAHLLTAGRRFALFVHTLTTGVSPSMQKRDTFARHYPMFPWFRCPSTYVVCLV